MITLSKNAQEATDAAVNNAGITTPETTPAKNKLLAYVNWSVPTKSGRMLNCDKGFPIFQSAPDAQYPSPTPSEQLLIDKAKQNGGVAYLNMKVRVTLVDNQLAPITVDDILVAA